MKAYYAALLQRQREQEAANREQELASSSILNGAYNASPQRQLGMKSKRDDEDEGDDVEWEEAVPAGKRFFLLLL